MMDWPWTPIAAIAQAVGTFVALVALVALIRLSDPVQKWRKRDELYNRLRPYDRDILKAIQDSRLGLSLIVLRMGDIEPIIGLVPSRNRNLVERHRLIVGQAFYQLSLESLESMGFLKSDAESYRLTGQGDRFIRKYREKLCDASYTGCYMDLMSPEILQSKTVRSKADVRKEPPPFEYGPDNPFAVVFSWIKILSHEEQVGGVEGIARVPRHNHGIKKSDTVYINIECPMPQFPKVKVFEAEVISVKELGSVDDKRMRIGEHTLMKLTNIHPYRREMADRLEIESVQTHGPKVGRGKCSPNSS